jgi:uncharacterized protein
MAIFKIRAMKPDTKEEKIIVYNSSVSTLKWEDSSDIIPKVKTQPDVEVPAKLEKGKKNLKTVKIQLGLSCNFECEYCCQRFVPKAEETNSDYIEDFIKTMPTWFEGGEDGLGYNSAIEYWGGEPFVYWKTLKPLVEAISLKYPNATHSIITNGSLMDREKINWIEKYNIQISISHDGPGQYVRGPDPLDNPKFIIELFKKLAPKGKISFNAMINSKNISRAKISDFFENFILKNVGDNYLKYLMIGEGGFIDAYDEDAKKNSLNNIDQDFDFRHLSYHELRDDKAKLFITIRQKIDFFLKTIHDGTRLESVSQKCEMDKSSEIAVDLRGNVLTCQNVSAISSNPSGVSHLLGNVNDLDSVIIKSGTHWSDRDECPQCPVIHICKGACLFLTGDLWETSCNNAFSDNISIFANAIEMLTGYVPIYIDGPQREDRKDIFWLVNGKPKDMKKPKKVIPINIIH